MTDLLGPANAANSVTTRPSDSRVFGGSDTWAKDASSPTANDGTSWSASTFNGLLAQIRALIRGMAITVDNTDDNMLLKAVQAAAPPYAVDTGTASALVVNVNQPGFTLAAGSRIRVKIAAVATGPTTIALTNGVTSLGTLNVTRRDASALNPYDLVTGEVADLTYDGTEFQIPRRGDGMTGRLMWLLAGATPTGFVPLNGLTIGDAASSATARANPDTLALFTFLYTNFSNTLCPVSGGRGANAAADFAAHKTITLPDVQGRSLVNVDAYGGASASNRLSGVTFNSGGSAPAAGSSGGEAAHPLTNGELATHTHTATQAAHSHTMSGLASLNAINRASGGVRDFVSGSVAETSFSIDAATPAITVNNAGSGTAHNNMQPFLTAQLYVQL